MIYFVSDGTAIKIGRANDVEIRLKDLQCGNPRKLALLGSVAGHSAHERKIHIELDQFRGSGEWFSDCEEVRAAVARYLAEGVEVQVAPAVDREEDEILQRCRAAAESLVRHEMREGHPKLTAYERVAALVGASAEWLRRFIRDGGDPKWSIGFAILQKAHALETAKAARSSQ